MYCSCYFLVFFSSLWDFLSSYVLAFVKFLLSSKDAILMLSPFSLIAIASHESLHLAFDLVGCIQQQLLYKRTHIYTYLSFNYVNAESTVVGDYKFKIWR